MSPSRLLKHARTEMVNLDQNPRHTTAAAHALKIYRSNSIYSFIPKNACSTMRLSLAIANCCIADASEFRWIHNNNGTFRARLEDLVTARYTFVILRDPFARLASCFLDRIVSRAVPARRLWDLVKPERDLDELTFAEFVEYLEDPVVLTANMHWRPQSDFLVYDGYDDYFSVENLHVDAALIAARAEIEVVDARALTAHGLDRYRMLSAADNHSRTPLGDIAQMKQTGQCPDPRSLYTPSIARAVGRLFAADVALHAEKIQPSTGFLSW